MTDHGTGTAGEPDLAVLRDEISRIEARISEEASDLTALREELEARQAELHRSLSGTGAVTHSAPPDEDDDEDDLFDDVPV